MIIQVAIIFFVLFALSRVFLQFRTKELTMREFIFWVLFWTFVGVVAVYPDLASRFADVIGVGRGADAVIYAALLGIFYLLFRIFVRIERIEQNMTKVVREIALRDAKHGHDHADHKQS